MKGSGRLDLSSQFNHSPEIMNRYEPDSPDRPIAPRSVSDISALDTVRESTHTYHFCHELTENHHAPLLLNAPKPSKSKMICDKYFQRQIAAWSLAVSIRIRVPRSSWMASLADTQRPIDLRSSTEVPVKAETLPLKAKKLFEKDEL